MALKDKDHIKLLRDRKWARHRASEYMIEGGRLWHMGGKKLVRARARKECVTQEEVVEMAREVHRTVGHLGRDLVKIQLMDWIKSPLLDQSILKVIQECGRCKGFSNQHLHSLLEQIRRRHPWELLVGDYLTMLKKKGSFMYLGVYLDLFSQHIWAFKYKKTGMGLTMVNALQHIGNTYTDPETVMIDGGSHFNNAEVHDFCKKRGIKLHIMAGYSAWVNRLVEGMNKILLGVLKRLCAPDLGENEYTEITNFSHQLKNWPDHLEEAIWQLNMWILPALKYSLKELALGLVVNTNWTNHNMAATEPNIDEIKNQLAYVEQQELDGYSQIVAHANRRKAVFNRHVWKKSPGEVIFKQGNLVQVYRISHSKLKES